MDRKKSMLKSVWHAEYEEYSDSVNQGTGFFYPSQTPIINHGNIWHITAVAVIEYEPRHDKTNKVTVCPAKTQISLGIRPV